MSSKKKADNGDNVDAEWFRSTVRSYSGKEFMEKLPAICGDMQNVLRILTFGIIIYDESTPEVRKILRDRDYWEALDKTSGDRMVIFTLLDREEEERNTTLEFMVAGRMTDRSPGKSYSALMKRMFDDESLLVYPSVLFFQVVDGAIYDYRLVPLQRKDIWDSFRAVQELFASLAKVLNGVAPEYYGNRKEIFNLIKD